MLPYLQKHLPVHENQFDYRPATGCIDVITVLKETAMYYNSQCFDVYCAMVDISKVYDRINTSLLSEKMRESDLPGQVIALINFVCKKTFVCTSLWKGTE